MIAEQNIMSKKRSYACYRSFFLCCKACSLHFVLSPLVHLISGRGSQSLRVLLSFSNMRKKEQKDGAFPMSPKASAALPYDIDNDIPSRMCGPAVLNNLLLKGGSFSPRNTSRRERFLHLGSQSVAESYQDMPDYQPSLDDIYSAERTKFYQVDNLVTTKSEDDQRVIFIPQFNVQKAKEHRAQMQPQNTAHHSVPEGSNENEQQPEHGHISSPSLSSISDKGRSKKATEITRESNIDSSVRDQRIERMMISMQAIIMQQEDNLNSLEEQNRQYREKLASFQDHIFSLKKEQLNQKNEIHKLNFERESFEAEAMSLKEELQTIRAELASAKKFVVEKEPFRSIPMSDTARSSMVEREPVTQMYSVSVPTNSTAKSSTMERQPVARSYSVSFEEHAEIFGEPVEDRDNDSTWERSRQRSIFRTKWNEADSLTKTPTKQTLHTLEEARHEGETQQEEETRQEEEEESQESHPKQSTSGKCTNIQELQQRATLLRETVARMNLDSPRESTLLRGSAANDTRDVVSSASSKRSSGLRYWHGEERATYRNRYNSHESAI